ncbi:Origin recognition complex subunit 3 [Collichthys lucidus]|uniref:Origin recognition complex subunit 3 n=1 Tax=Collichthys lucidus TaxID=240159 RepID=A0A4U5VFB1_COLLU|nr:Origin recognition complex subunit 3 [Collichthys lucidus]
MRNICAYAVVIVVKMAEGETEKEYDTRKAIEELRERFQGLTTALKESSQSPLEASLHFCQEFCQVLVEHAGRWKTDEDPLPLLEVYTVAILSFAKAASCLSAECENVPLLLEKLALSCAELLLLLPQHVPGALWEEFQSSMKVGEVGLPVCVEMCIQALKMTSSDHKDSKSTICKTISCLLPTDLEVKRACQLTEFLLQPTIDSYYAVESLYNEPDQKPEEDGSLPVPNSLRCELLLALKTQWPFDPEFWDWKTLKRNCLALMGEEAAIVSSIDTLNDTDEQEVESALGKHPEYRDLEDFLLTTTNELNEITDEREKNREAKKLREQGFVSARFRNWRAYMQYCVLCDKEFLGHRIVRHAQKHFKDGVAMHQASLPPSKPEIETEKTSVQNGEEFNETISKDNEVRCQVKDCSRVFMGITRLVQHYLLLHKFTRDKATAMMASMTIGTFNCDRPECALPFNSVEKYIEHIKNFHKEIAISESGSVDPTFRCEYEACDRVYTTKSNLLRHLIKKHDYVYDPKTSDGRRTKSVGLFPGVNGKENMENKFKVKKKNTKKKDGKSIEHWTSFGKPTLKSHEEASAMCIKKSALQYPCMIIGCDAVERAERSIFKHYTTHGLTERYIEDQRSQFIFCKKYSRARFKDSNKSEGASSSSSEETEPEDSEKPSDQKTDELMDRIGQENSKHVLQDELNRKILDSLLDFTRKCSSTRQHSDWASQMRASEIPTAALVLGVNVPDHDMTFQSLSELLQQSVSPHVASVQAKECGALKHLMKRVLERLMGTVVTVDDEEEEEAEQTQLHKGVHCSLNTLCDWYNTKTKKSNTVSPGKKRSSPVRDDPQQPPVVVIFKDLEAFNPKVLQDFILICSRYIERLPLMFIFGIATSPSTIQHMLPHSVSSLLCIELFQSLSCTQHLAYSHRQGSFTLTLIAVDTCLAVLILTPHFPFKLNGKVMQVLISIFLYHDFSVRNFIKGVQLALLEHFHSQPLSALCCKKKEALLNVMQLSNSHLERIRHLPSFKRYVEKQEPQEQENLLTDDAHLKDVCQKLIKDLRKYHKNYYPVLRCLHTLTSSLPRELHLICLEKNVWENEDYQTAMKLLKMLAKDELIALLERCVETLQPVKSKKMKSALVQLKDLLAKLKQLDTAETPPCVDDCITSPVKNLQKKTDLFQLQKTLLEMNESRRAKKLSPFEVLRNEALEVMDGLVKSHLSPPETQTLYEVCYYTSSATVRRHLNATPRTSIQAALSSPYYYLQNESLKTEDGTVSNCCS